MYANKLYGTPPTPAFQAQYIKTICAKTQVSCTGNNSQYKSTEDCVAQLTAKNYGSFDEVWADNVVCRSIHALLAAMRPEAHCVHVGPTGGGKCVDVDYDEVYVNGKLSSWDPMRYPAFLDMEFD